MSITDQTTNTVGDWAPWLLFALGVTSVSFAEYIGGLFFAFGFAMITRHWFPEQDRREIWWTLLVAFLVATIGAEFYVRGFEEPPLPVQFAMAGLGLCSRVIVTLTMKLLLRTEARSDEIVDRVIDKKLED